MRTTDTAVRHLVTDVPIESEQAAVARVLAKLGQQAYAAADPVLVVDGYGRFAGAIALDVLVRARPTQHLAELMDRDYPRVHGDEDQEHVAGAALARRVASVVVVDADNHPIGIVPARSLLAILREEHVEDLHRLAGIRRETVRDREALEGPPARRARHRLPWLLLGLGGSMVAALIMSRFEAILSRDLEVAFFVPAIVYLADAIGTQTEAIAVRGLSLSRLSLRHLIADEMRTGFLIGVTLAALAFPLVAFAFEIRLAIAVSSAIVGAGAVATTIGLLLPWLLLRRGHDPAFGSGPVATIIQDVTSLIVYFALASLIMD